MIAKVFLLVEFIREESEWKRKRGKKRNEDSEKKTVGFSFSVNSKEAWCPPRRCCLVQQKFCSAWLEFLGNPPGISRNSKKCRLFEFFIIFLKNSHRANLMAGKLFYLEGETWGRCRLGLLHSRSRWSLRTLGTRLQTCWLRILWSLLLPFAPEIRTGCKGIFSFAL